MQIGIHHTVEADLRRAALGIIEEVQAVAAAGQVSHQFAVERVAGRCGYSVLRHGLLRPQAVVVIAELNRRSRFAHLPQLSSRAPGVGPRAVVQRVADLVIGDALPVVARQLVLPVGVAVDIGHRLYGLAHFSRRIGIPRLAHDVPAKVIAVDPRRVLVRVNLSINSVLHHIAEKTVLC